MEVAIQAPISLLSEYCTSTTYHLCRPDLILESEAYRNFYTNRKEQGDYVILDCSGSEPRKSIPTDKLVEATKLLKPNLVTAPDYDVGSTKTVELTIDFIRSFEKEVRKLRVGILGMVQGATLRQCLLCYSSTYKLVDAVGLPRSMEVGIGRAAFLKRIRTNKPIHIFGIHGNPEKELDELLDLEKDNLYGISTSLPVRLGLQCRLLDEYQPEPPQLDYYSSYNPYPEFTLNNIKDFILLAEV